MALARTTFIVAEVMALATLAILAAIVIAHPAPLPGDLPLTLGVQHLMRPHAWLAAPLNLVSNVNWPLPAGLMAVVFISFLVVRQRWLDAFVALATLAAAAGTNTLINRLVQRPRPDGMGVVVEMRITGSYSFPSGHVEHALAFLGFLLFLTWQVRRPNLWLWPVRLFLALQIVLMVPARILSGEHWPSDVLAGLLIGGFWLLVAVAVYRWAADRWPALIPPTERREASMASWPL